MQNAVLIARRYIFTTTAPRLPCRIAYPSPKAHCEIIMSFLMIGLTLTTLSNIMYIQLISFICQSGAKNAPGADYGGN